MSIHVQFGFSRLTVFKMVVAILDYWSVSESCIWPSNKNLFKVWFKN
jgi:hypothetical protein